MLRLLRVRVEAGARVCPSAATATDIAEVERALGLRLPAFYVRLLTEVANGGFGPGFGLIGIPPHGFIDDDLGGNLVETYLQGRACEDLAWRTPRGLLHLCNWGCGTFSYVDTLSASAAVVTHDVLEDRVEYTETSVALAEWLSDWVAGVNLEDAMYETIGDRDGINPFTKKPMKIPIRRRLGRRLEFATRG